MIRAESLGDAQHTRAPASAGRASLGRRLAPATVLRFRNGVPTYFGPNGAATARHVASAHADSDFPNLTVLTHPVIQHKLTILRDKRTGTRDFKLLVGEIAMLMAYEVTQDLPLAPVDTPEATSPGPGRRGRSSVRHREMTL